MSFESADEQGSDPLRRTFEEIAGDRTAMPYGVAYSIGFDTEPPELDAPLLREQSVIQDARSCAYLGCGENPSGEAILASLRGLTAGDRLGAALFYTQRDNGLPAGFSIASYDCPITASLYYESLGLLEQPSIGTLIGKCTTGLQHRGGGDTGLIRTAIGVQICRYQRLLCSYSDGLASYMAAALSVEAAFDELNLPEHLRFPRR